MPMIMVVNLWNQNDVDTIKQLLTYFKDLCLRDFNKILIKEFEVIFKEALVTGYIIYIVIGGYGT